MKRSRIPLVITACVLVSNVNNVRLLDFKVNNGHIMCSATGGTTMTNIQAKGIYVVGTTSAHSAAVNIYCDSSSTINGLMFGNVVSKGSHTDGFRFGGSGSGTIKNLEMRFCRSENSGLTTPRVDTSVGYRFGAGVSMQSAKIIGCDAAYSWCSGFYFTAGASMTSITLSGCSSNYNGQKGDAANGMGYQLNGQAGVQLVNCDGIGNKGALIA